MPFPERPTYKVAHGVLGVDQPLNRQPGLDEALIAALREEFPMVGPRQILPTEAPPNLPHLILQSTSSQVAISISQIDFEVRFYGDYATSLDLCDEYVRRKMTALLRGWQAIGAQPVLAGLVLTLGFSLMDEPDIEPATFMLEHHLRAEVPGPSVQDVKTHLGLRVADHLFVSLDMSTFEARQLMRPVLPGQQALVVRPWEGTIADAGIDVAIDVNNRLRAVTQERWDPVDEAELGRVLDMARFLTENSALPFVRDGELNVDAITAAVA